MEGTDFSCRILMKLEFFFDRLSTNPQNITFHENPSSGKRAVSCWQQDGPSDGRYFVNEPKNSTFCPTQRIFVFFGTYLRSNSDYFSIQH